MRSGTDSRRESRGAVTGIVLSSSATAPQRRAVHSTGRVAAEQTVAEGSGYGGGVRDTPGIMAVIQGDTGLLAVLQGCEDSISHGHRL